MPRQAPKVIAGMRGAIDTRMESMHEIERAESNPELAQVTIAGLDEKKGTLYFSKFPSYRVQITSPGDSINPVTGQRTRQKGIVAVFKNGRYLNDGSVPGNLGANKKQKEELRAMIDRQLQDNFKFGAPGQGDFWLATEQQRVIREKNLKSARATLKSLPKEVLDEFVGSLKQGDKVDHSVEA